MSEETRNILLYRQLNEGLRYNLIKSPAVSGASGYQQLCIATKNEERRQNELMKRQQYQHGDQRTNRTEKSSRHGSDSKDKVTNTNSGDRGSNAQKHLVKCWNCKKASHQAKDCRQVKESRGPRQESTGQSTGQTKPGMKMVQSDDTRQEEKSSDQGHDAQSETRDDPLQYLLSGSDDEDPTVGVIHVTDEGSKCQCVKVVVGGASLLGIVDSGADITIMESTAFKQVASVAWLKK